MGKKFRDDYGVFCCPHVFNNERPVLLVVRDTDGTWQFLCGQPDENVKEPPRLVGIGHLLERDPTLDDMANLEKGGGAERDSAGMPWKYFDL